MLSNIIILIISSLTILMIASFIIYKLHFHCKTIELEIKNLKAGIFNNITHQRMGWNIPRK